MLENRYQWRFEIVRPRSAIAYHTGVGAAVVRGGGESEWRGHQFPPNGSMYHGIEGMRVPGWILRWHAGRGNARIGNIPRCRAQCRASQGNGIFFALIGHYRRV
jgi:hypothetical protein